MALSNTKPVEIGSLDWLYKVRQMMKIISPSINITLNRKAIENNGIKVDDILNRIQQYTAEGTKGFISINQNIFPIVIHSDLQSDTNL